MCENGESCMNVSKIFKCSYVTILNWIKNKESLIEKNKINHSILTTLQKNANIIEISDTT